MCSDAAVQARHAPVQEFAGGRLIPYPEDPSRYRAIRDALQAASWPRWVDAQAIDEVDLAAVHETSFLQFLRQTSDDLTGAEELTASVFAHPAGRRPVPGRASVGYYGFDTTPLTAGSWEAALSACAAARTAADIVIGGATVAYSLTRPPGHHAGPATFGGYCYLNHAAVAARALSAHGRVAIVDIDYHHGNGTQQIFFEDGDVFVLSLHADPAFEYPCYWGFADESGTGAGAGRTLNVPLPAGVEAPEYLTQLCRSLEAIEGFAPRYVVISVGFDTYVHDPLGTFRLDIGAYAQVAEALSALRRPTVIVQEGGYHVDDLGRLAMSFLEPFVDHTVEET